MPSFHAFLHFCIAHFQVAVVMFFFNQTLPVCLITEREFYKLQKFGLNQIRRVLQKFPNKNQKKLEKEKGKKLERERRAGGSTSAWLPK
jgi:hypothetical protein